MSPTFSTFSTLSCVAFLPVIGLLSQAGSWLVVPYAGSLVAMLAYHLSSEQRWRRLDHVFAWSVIVANAWLAVGTRSVGWTSAGLALVAGSLAFYRQAHRGPYHAWHGLWHLSSGAACFCFARGYLAA